MCPRRHWVTPLTNDCVGKPARPQNPTCAIAYRIGHQKGRPVIDLRQRTMALRIMARPLSKQQLLRVNYYAALVEDRESYSIAR
ncbi:hypothetical protein EMEDMD4_980039 [Sinorhizobium medicae]|uniref:Transposase n=1 Tax=Sinorhizobium medicae TaxID=110321 RepID=A0A508XCC1_9HYPH|nr:hypothetical protein EMEDMD4_980039 [Sinorhizobium medicae]